MQVSTDQLTDQLAEMLRDLFVNPDANHFAVIEKHQLTITQVRSLVVLAESEEQVPIGTLVERLGITPPTASRTVDALVSRKLVSRRECRDDRRVRNVAITAAGRKVVDEIASQRRAGLQRWLEALDSDAKSKLSAALAEIAGQRGWER